MFDMNEVVSIEDSARVVGSSCKDHHGTSRTTKWLLNDAFFFFLWVFFSRFRKISAWDFSGKTVSFSKTFC